MPLSIAEVNYSYPIGPTVGSTDISTSQNISGKSIDAILDAYKKLFSNYGEVANALFEKMKLILGKKSNGTLDLKNISNIFDDDNIISNAYNYKECKEGIKAYKFYLKEAITKLCDLYDIIDEAELALTNLNNISENNEDTLNDKAHVFITKLECCDKQAQDIIKAFMEYSIVKNLTVSKEINYHDGVSKHSNEQIDHRTYECVEKAYRSLNDMIDKTTGLNSISDLQKIQTEKQAVERTYVTSYYCKKDENELVDKYDLLAQIKVECKDGKPDSTTSNIALFDELTLLEKLQYIRIYYSDTSASRYVYPEDNRYGYPCIEPTKSQDAIEDTKELGHIEMFYLGYIINRDGPINALASFLEIKTTAIKSQIKVLMERVKAIKTYSNLLQKGFEEFSRVATNYGEKNEKTDRNSIPHAAFYIYRYLSTSATRCFYYINNEPYIVIQYSNAKKGEFCKDEGKDIDQPNGTSHPSPSNYYILVKANDDGIKAFVSFLDKNITYVDPGDSQKDYHERVLDILFTKKYGKDDDKYGENKVSVNDNNYGCKYNDSRYYHIFLEAVSESSFSYFIRMDDKDKVWSSPEWHHDDEKDKEKSGDGWHCYWWINREDRTVTCDGNNVRFKQIPENELPKELDIAKVSGSTITEVPWQDGMSWNKLTPAMDNDDLKAQELSSFVSMWETQFNTIIANYKTGLDQQEKEISTLQKKIQTFDATSTNFRNKAFTVYNKIVNKIK